MGGQSTESRSVSGGGDNEEGTVADLVKRFTTGSQKVKILVSTSDWFCVRGRKKSSIFIFPIKICIFRVYLTNNLSDGRTLFPSLTMYEAYNLNCCSGAKKILPQVYFSQIKCSLELHFYYALEVISILSLIAGSYRPNSILGSVDFNISHEFYRQKNNSKIEPNTVFEDMLERNNSLLKQTGNAENLSLDNRQDCSISAGETWRAKVAAIIYMNIMLMKLLLDIIFRIQMNQ